MVAFRDISVGKPIALVVESEPALRRLTSTILRQNGYRVYESGIGVEECLLKEDQGSLQLLVVGMNLAGGQSGLAVAKEVWDKNPAVRIIVTGASRPEDHEMSMVRSAGMTFLSLPYSFGRLSQAASARSDWAAVA